MYITMKRCCEHHKKYTESGETICYCFEITKTQVIEEIRELGYSPSLNYVRDMAKKGLCRCEEKNPEGVCCLPNFEKFVKEVSS